MKPSNRSLVSLLPLLGLAIGLTPQAWAQNPVVNLPKPDGEGWIRLFRGNNTADFYTFYGDSKRVNPFPDNVFTVKADTVVVTGNPVGHLMFRQSFSHYHIRFQMMMPSNLGNAGMLVHVQEGDPSLWGTFPRSIECQGDPNQGMGQIWCISNVWVTVRAKMAGNTPQYDSTAPAITYGAKSDNNRQILGDEKPSLKVGEWVTIEAIVHGSDSLEHRVRGRTIVKYTDPHVAPPNDPAKIEKMLKSGLLAWQSEGVPVRYRNIEIKLFPEDPLYKSLYPTTGITDYRILPKQGAKPALGLNRNAILILKGDGHAITLSGRSLPLP
jgi:hypothetical protein